jgi:SAM-dependent methyltransferase
MHMLYHVHEPLQVLAELRRVVRAGGGALIVLNGTSHQRQLRTLLDETSLDFGEPAASAASELFDLDAGEELAARFFDVARHELNGELVVPEPGPVLAYVKSMSFVQSGRAREAEMLRSVDAKVSETITAEGAFRITTSCGCLVCR